MSNNEFFETRVRDIATKATALRAPADSWARIAARVSAGEEVIVPVRAQTPPMRAPYMRVAAVSALVITAAVAAATIPGSPLKKWLDRNTGAEAVTPPVVAPRTVEQPPELATTFIVTPVDELVIISFLNPQEMTRVHVEFVETSEVYVRARGEAANASFRSSEGKLTVAQANGGDVHVAIPRSLAHVRVEVNGTAYFIKRNGQVRVLAPAADTAGSEYVLPIGRRP